MKALTQTKKKLKTTTKPARALVKSLPVQPQVRQAQCCAKVSTTVAGCHD